MDPTVIAMAELTQDRQEAANLAVDIADHITAQSIDFAQNAICSYGMGPNVLALATAHAHIAAKVYAAHELNAALRELTPEIAGAISEAGTDVGAGIFQALQALKPRSCNRTR